MSKSLDIFQVTKSINSYLKIIYNCYYHSFYLLSCLGQETAKGHHSLRVKLPLAHPPLRTMETFHDPFNC